MNLDSITKILVIVIIALLICTILMLCAWGIVAAVTDTPLFGSTRPEKLEQNTQADTSDIPANTVPDSAVVLGESADMGQGYIDSIIFLGDSTTYHMINRAVLTDGTKTKQVWSGENCSLTLDHMIDKTTIIYPRNGSAMTIADAVALEKPKYMVITLGINGVSFLKENNFTAYYGKLIDAIRTASPETKIIIQSIFPVSSEYDRAENGITNAKIEQANVWAMQIANQKGCRYLNTASVLKNSEGALTASYDAGDGHHLTKDAYLAILQYIRTHGYVE